MFKILHCIYYFNLLLSHIFFFLFQFIYHTFVYFILIYYIMKFVIFLLYIFYYLCSEMIQSQRFLRIFMQNWNVEKSTKDTKYIYIYILWYLKKEIKSLLFKPHFFTIMKIRLCINIRNYNIVRFLITRNKSARIVFHSNNVFNYTHIFLRINDRISCQKISKSTILFTIQWDY